jgi:hypothetical protein
VTHIVKGDLTVEQDLIARRALGLPMLTTAERDALTGLIAGTKIWNTTTEREETWDGSAWVFAAAALPPAVIVGWIVYRGAENPAKHVYELNGQTLAGGVATYPVLAAKLPQWVSGADIVLPDWRGRFLRCTNTPADASQLLAWNTDLTGFTYQRISAIGSALKSSGSAIDPDENLPTNGTNTNLVGRFNGSTSPSYRTWRPRWQSGRALQTSSVNETRPTNVALRCCVIAG